MSARMEISIPRPPGNRVKSDPPSQLEFCHRNVGRELMCGHHAQVCSFSSLRSSLLRLDRTFVRPWICTDDTQASRLQAMLSQSNHRSGGRRVCWTCSSAPVYCTCSSVGSISASHPTHIAMYTQCERICNSTTTLHVYDIPKDCSSPHDAMHSLIPHFQTETRQ